MRSEHRLVRVAGAAADVLRPPIARVARAPEAIARVAADEVAAVTVDGEQPRVRPADLRADPGIELERGDIPSARAAASAGRRHPSPGAGAVHQPEVVGLDLGPAAAT